MDKKLIEEIGIDGFEGKVQLYSVNDKYYSVEYKGKEEYYTTKKDVAFDVSNTILAYSKYLIEGFKILNQNKSNEAAWVEVVSYVREKSSISNIDYQACHAVYKSLESAYYDQIDNKVKDISILSTRRTIKSKDNLVNAIANIVFPVNKKEAERNIEIYRGARNDYVKKNPQLELNPL